MRRLFVCRLLAGGLLAAGLSAAGLLVACGDDVAPADGGVRDAQVDSALEDSGETSCREGDPCDADGNGCTQDLCRSGVCTVGPPVACNDGASCTEDACESTGPMTFECTHQAGADRCVIEDTCFAEGDPNPENACQVCDPATGSRRWTAHDGACDDGDVCTTNDTCTGGTCQGDVRVDAYEDNNSEDTAAALENITDSDAFPFAMFEATLYPDGDEDYYRFRDSDGRFARIFPRVELRSIPTGSNYELCAFLQCADGGSASAGCEIGMTATSGGMNGCCSDAPSNGDEVLRIDPDCSGTDDSVDVWVRVRRLSGIPACEAPYTILYGDD